MALLVLQQIVETTQNLEAGPPKPGWRRLPSPERGPAQCLGSVSCRTGHQRTRMASETFEVSFAQSSYLLFYCCPRLSHGIMHRNCIHWVDGVDCIDCLQGAREARTEALRGMQECATRWKARLLGIQIPKSLISRGHKGSKIDGFVFVHHRSLIGVAGTAFPSSMSGVMQKNWPHSLVCLGIGMNMPRPHKMYRKARTLQQMFWKVQMQMLR